MSIFRWMCWLRGILDYLRHPYRAFTVAPRIAGVDDANRPTRSMGCFAIYTTKEHTDILKAFPELMSGGPVFIKDTYEEASAAAALSVLRTLAYTGINAPVRIYYHPHDESSDDPMNLVGSWGWKTTGKMTKLVRDQITDGSRSL